MRDSSGGRNSVSQPFLELPRLRPTKAQRLSDWTINRIAQPRCLARLGSPELIQKSGDAISRVFAKTLTLKGTEKTLLTAQSKTVIPFLIRLNEPRFTVRSLSSLSGLRQIHIEPTHALRCKSTVYGLNGLRPSGIRRTVPSI